MNSDNHLMSYNQFCRHWNVDNTIITPKTYVDIKMAIQKFNCPIVTYRDISRIDNKVSLLFFKNTDNEVSEKISGGKIRCQMQVNSSPDDLPALKAWNRHLNKNYIDWTQVLDNVFKALLTTIN